MKNWNNFSMMKYAGALFVLISFIFGKRVFENYLTRPSYEEMEEKPPETFVPGVEPSYSASLAALPGRSWIAKMLGGDDVFDVVTKPERGFIFRIDENDETLRKKTTSMPRSIAIKPDALRRIVSILSSQTSYEENLTQGKLCSPHYVSKIRLEKDSNVVDIFLCFDCMQMHTAWNGELRRAVYIDPIASELLLIVQKFFPDDFVIQSIKSHR